MFFGTIETAVDILRAAVDKEGELARDIEGPGEPGRGNASESGSDELPVLGESNRDLRLEAAEEASANTYLGLDFAGEVSSGNGAIPSNCFKLN